MKKLFDQTNSYLTQSPTRFFFVAAIAAFFVLWFVNAYHDPNGFSWHDIIVEAHGVLFDLLVFGILLSIYDSLRAKRDLIGRLQEEIYDYRGWKSEEAVYRRMEAIRRLNRKNFTAIDLQSCYLYEANLYDVKLDGADMSWGNLIGINLCGASLKNTKLINCNLSNSNLRNADLRGANLSNSNLQGVILKGANLENTKFENSKFIGNIQKTSAGLTKLPFVLLTEALVGENWFIKLKDWNVEGVEFIEQTYYIDENNRLQLKEPLQP